VAISNDRLVSVDAGQVRFHSTGLTAGRWRDYARGNRVRTMTLSAAEFLRRFLLHVLPTGFVRTCLRAAHRQIRHFGLLANRGRTAKLARCRALLTAGPPEAPAGPETVVALMLRLTGVDLTRCPVCHAGRLRVVAIFRPGQIPVPRRARGRPQPWTPRESARRVPLAPRVSAGPPEARTASPGPRPTPGPRWCPCGV